MNLSHNWKLHITFLVVVSSILIFWNLGSNSLRDLDEALQAQASKEMLVSGNWLTPHIRNVPYFHKPPLSFWLMGLSFAVFGINEFAVRFFCGVFGIGIVLLIYVFAAKLFKDKRIALFSSFILVTSSQFLFERGARSGEEDIILIFFATLALFFFWLSQENIRYVYCAGISLALAILTKGPLALMYVSVFLFFSLFNSGKRIANTINFLKGVTIGILCSFPWFLLEWVYTKQNFFKIYIAEFFYFFSPAFIQKQNTLVSFLQRDTIERLNFACPGISDAFYFLNTAKFGFFPWIIVVIFSIILLFSILFRKKDELGAGLFVLSWIFWPLLILSSFEFKSFWWLTFVFPALAIATAFFLVKMLDGKVNPVALIALLFIFVFIAPIQYVITRYTSIANLELIFPKNLKFSLNWALLIFTLFLSLAFFLNFFKVKLIKQVSSLMLRRIGPAVLVLYLSFISLFNVISLAKASTYKSDLNVITEFIKENYKNHTLLVIDQGLYRMQYGKLTIEFPTYFANGIIDKWSEYFYLNNLDGIVLKFLNSGRGEGLGLLREKNKSTEKLVLLNKENIQLLRAADLNFVQISDCGNYALLSLR